MSVYILSSARTPIASFLGPYSNLGATALGGHAIKEAVSRSKIPAEKIDEVIMGQVVQAGSGQAPARQATISSGLPNSCLLYTSPSPRDQRGSRMPSSA